MKKLLFGLACLVVLSIWAAPGNKSIRLGWQPNTEPEVYGYGVYWGIINSGVTNSGFSPTNSVSISSLANGQYWFAVTARGTNSVESDFSNIVTATIPRNPSNLVVQ